MHVWVEMPDGYYGEEAYWFDTISEARQWIKSEVAPYWTERIGPGGKITIRKDTDNDPRWDYDDWCIIEDILGEDVGVYKVLLEGRGCSWEPDYIPKILLERSSGRMYDYRSEKEISQERWQEIQDEINGVSKSLPDIEQMIKSRRTKE